MELEQLEGFDEIWALCQRRPGAGWRLVGRFLETNILVILGIHDKRDIGTDYSPVVSKTISAWNYWLPGVEPCRGPWLAGYLTGEHYDIDEAKKGSGAA